MRLAGSYEVAAERDRVYSLLQAPEVLAACMPGCKHLALIGENEYEMKMNVIISSISGRFDGKVRIADESPPDGFRLLVDGTGRAGFLKGDGRLVLVPNGGTTEVRYEGDVQTGGLIASVGQRLLDATAKLMIKRFFSKFAERAGGETQAAGG